MNDRNIVFVFFKPIFVAWSSYIHFFVFEWNLLTKPNCIYRYIIVFLGCGIDIVDFVLATDLIRDNASLALTQS